MEENKSLNNKYQKIDIDEAPTEAQVPDEKPVKEKKVKAPKEKKVKEPKVKKEKAPKEPKPPKEKKVKEPKPPKPPKEKKEKAPKEPKPPKEKKVKEAKEKKAKEIKLPNFKKEKKENVQPTSVIEETEVAPKQTEYISNGRRTEEVVLPVVKSVKQISADSDKPKKEKKAKTPKIKELKKPKEKKVKEPKENKLLVLAKEKTEKKKTEKAKEPKQPKEKKPREALVKKDYVTICMAIVALALIASFVVVKYFPESEIGTDFTETTTQSQDKLSSIQVAREGVVHNLIQSEIPDVFYGYSADYKLQYYQYKNDKMVAVQSTGSVNATVDMGNEDIPVKIDYVELGGKIFGAGLFVANKTENVYFYDMLAFQLVNLPKGYEQEGKALLLVTTSKNALTQKITMWPESFVVDLETGKTTRFLKVINRNLDVTTGAGVEDFCLLTNEGYVASGKIPFISAREYEAGSGQQDIFIKNGSKEELYVSDVYGKFLLTDGNSVIFMRKTDKGFDVVRKTGDEEKVTASFFGTMSPNYMQTGDYVFNKNDGKLHNLITGEEKTVIGYRMSAEMMAVSPDGKYLVMLGTVVNMMDYQVHVFNLQTGDYVKFKDENYSSHSNLAFINDSTVVYVALDPNQGYEYVALDVTKVK